MLTQSLLSLFILSLMSGTEFFGVEASLQNALNPKYLSGATYKHPEFFARQGQVLMANNPTGQNGSPSSSTSTSSSDSSSTSSSSDSSSSSDGRDAVAQIVDPNNRHWNSTKSTIYFPFPGYNAKNLPYSNLRDWEDVSKEDPAKVGYVYEEGKPFRRPVQWGEEPPAFIPEDILPEPNLGAYAYGGNPYDIPAALYHDPAYQAARQARLIAARPRWYNPLVTREAWRQALGPNVPLNPLAEQLATHGVFPPNYQPPQHQAPQQIQQGKKGNKGRKERQGQGKHQGTGPFNNGPTNSALPQNQTPPQAGVAAVAGVNCPPGVNQALNPNQQYPQGFAGVYPYNNLPGQYVNQVPFAPAYNPAWNPGYLGNTQALSNWPYTNQGQANPLPGVGQFGTGDFLQKKNPFVNNNFGPFTGGVQFPQQQQQNNFPLGAAPVNAAGQIPCN